MTDPRDDFGPYWLQTVAPFGPASEPPSAPTRTPWQHPLIPHLLAAVMDSSKVPIPPARPPWFPGMPMKTPSIGETPAWMESAMPPDEPRGILGQISRRTPPAPGGWNPSGPSPWRQPVVASVEPPATLAPSIDDDPFTRAAARTRQSVQPPFGRQPGIATLLLQNLVPAAVQGVPAAVQAIATLPQRAMKAAGDLHKTGEYDPGPAVETAMLMVGSPLTPAGALGSAARRPPPRLPMDRASRMQRARELGYADEPFYRGERTGALSDEYPRGGYFSRDKSYADGFAQVGGRPEAREFRLDLRNALKDYQPVTAEQYGRVVASAIKRNPMLAEKLVDHIAPGGSVEWFLDFAKAEPNFIVADSGAHVRKIVGTSSDPRELLKGAGFDALDSGRDVRKLTGQGIRLESAAFDPARRRSRNINRSIFGAGAVPLMLLDPDPNRD